MGNISSALLHQLSSFDDHSRAILFDRPAGQEGSRLYLNPKHWIRVSTLESVCEALERLEELRKEFSLLGYLSYEAGAALEPVLPRRTARGPLLEFAAFSGPCQAADSGPGFGPGSYRISNLAANLSPAQYARAFQEIQQHIRRGDVYQVNFTFRLQFEFEGDPRALFLSLRRSQPVSNGLLMRNGNRWVLSLSPELFFSQRGRRIELWPMKGTAPRGRWLEEDQDQIRRLRNDPKNQAENLMVVDLIRNDLGRICEWGSIAVSDLFAVQRLPTVLQMTSVVSGRLRPTSNLAAVVGTLFPSGSVTGAPKIAAMKLIHRLEKISREVYCGAVGRITAGEADLNVGIRTLVLQRVDSKEGRPAGRYRGELGIGSGLVADSDVQEEWEEACLKSHFLIRRSPDFRLLESFRLEDGVVSRKNLHLRRLGKSATYFGFCFPEARIISVLEEASRKHRSDTFKLRLELHASGDVDIEIHPLPQLLSPVNLGIAAEGTDPQDPIFFHKTTRRQFYNAAIRLARQHGLWDLAFSNVQGELTEGAISNIFVRTGGKWRTPRIECGLLPGVMREVMIQELSPTVETLTLTDLLEAETVLLTNSVRGALTARPVPLLCSITTGRVMTLPA